MSKYFLANRWSILANEFSNGIWHNFTYYCGVNNHFLRGKTPRRPLAPISLGIIFPIVILILFGGASQIFAHGRYEWMMNYKTKTGASCCGIDDCGKILSFDANNKHITIQNQSGRVWNVRYRFASATLHYSPDGNKYACGTYSSYVPNYARCIWLPQEAKANQQQRFAINYRSHADQF